MPIKKGALTVFVNVDLSRVRVTEFQQRYPEQVERYTEILDEHPDDHLGLILLKPSSDGYFEILDGHHRYLAYVMMGRQRVLAVIIDERHIDDPRREDPGFVEGVCAELAAQAGDDVRRASLGDLSAEAERGAAQIAAVNRVVADWAVMRENERSYIRTNDPELAAALDALKTFTAFNK